MALYDLPGSLIPTCTIWSAQPKRRMYRCQMGRPDGPEREQQRSGQRGSAKGPISLVEERPTSTAIPDSPAAFVVALNAKYGNRRVARSLSHRLARQPVKLDPSQAALESPRLPWVEQTTFENRGLATEVDELERLSDEQLRAQREIVAMRASKWGDGRHEEYERTLEAIEFLSSRRAIAPLAYQDAYYCNDQHAIRRRNVRVVIEAGVRETGSLKKSIEGMRQSKDIEPDVDFFEREAERFGKEFTRQAKQIANKMLAESTNEMLLVLESYGLKRDWAVYGRNQILKPRSVDDVAGSLVRFEDAWTPEPENPTNDPGKYSAERKRRLSLAAYVRKLKRRQGVVQERRKEKANAADALVDYGEESHGRVRQARPPDPEKVAKFQVASQRLQQSVDELTELWARSEATHPVLAAFRGGKKDLDDVDLGSLEDTKGGSEPQMLEMLKTVLPKLADIRRVHYRIEVGDVKPLSLPPVVALTKAVMFVPEGSLRDGKVTDLVDDAQDKTVSGYIAKGLIALIVLATLLPSGGTSLGVAIGLAGAALSATSAVEDWETYKKQKLLVNTALDRAKALSTEEPSLLPFAIDLISLGFDGAPLVKAFAKGLELRNLVRAGEGVKNAEKIKSAVDELNDLGKAKGKPDLGKKALQDVRGAEHDAEAAKAPAAGEPGGKTPTTPGRVRVPPTAEGAALLKRYGSRAEVVKAVEKRLATAGTARPIGWERAFEALLATPSRINRKIIAQLDKVMSALQNPKLYAEVLGDAWELVRRGEAEDINAALKAMAERSGLKVGNVKSIMKGDSFFTGVVSKPEYWTDEALGKEAHGEYTHLLQELVVDRALGAAGESVKFRADLLKNAKGTVAKAEMRGGKLVPSRWVTGDDGTKFENDLFLGDESKMTTGDYVWRWTYDLFYDPKKVLAIGRLPQPELVRPILNTELGFGLK